MRPKPMVEIGGYPILWHIVKSYASYGVRDFVICLGYKGYMIKEYFSNLYLHTSDFTVDLSCGDIQYHRSNELDWKVTLLDTGLDTMTGGRIKRAANYIHKDRPFFFTYGDGLSNVDYAAQLAYHCGHGKLATLTSVVPPGRFGTLAMNEDNVTSFIEKPAGDGAAINGGFFVLEPKVFEYIAGDNIPLEDEPLRNLAKEGQLKAWRHEGFWQSMDTLRDRNFLEQVWKTGAPWKTWSD